jgi:hypothetical protein
VTAAQRLAYRALPDHAATAENHKLRHAWILSGIVGRRYWVPPNV